MKRDKRGKASVQTKRLLILIILSVCVTGIQAQVSLEHTYNYSGTLTEIDNNEFKYFIQDVPLAQCRIYNEDHTPYKTINLDVPEGYILNDTKFVTKRLFNNDDYVELLYIYYKTTMLEGEVINQYGLKVVNELGTVLMTLSNGGFAEIQKGSEGMKLFAYQYIYFDGYYLIYTNIYSLGGTMKSAPLEAESAINIYPNPATDMVTMTINPWEQISKGQVMITDLSGRMLSKEPIQKGDNITRIETGWMSPGTYVMSLISNKKIIASEKIEIK
jgi:hypothetical protein